MLEFSRPTGPIRKESKKLRIPLFSSATKTLIFLLATNVIAWGRTAKDKEPAALLKNAARTFEHLSYKSKNTIPDAVLNRTKCVVVIPGVAHGTDHLVAGGVATYREASDRWGDPVFVLFNKDPVRADGGDLLIFILKDAGVQALRSGKLPIRAQSHVTAPLVSTTPVPSQVELTTESLVYEYTAGVLSGSRASGIIRLKNDRNTPLLAQSGGQVPEEITQHYLSSLVSFFNTITPTGIVIHHTALIPGENTLPRTQADIDTYHQSRGFEITCFGRVYHAAYHYLIFPDGRVQAGRPERCEGAHAEGYNSYLGISLVGDFSSEDNPRGEKGPIRPSEKQIASLTQLCLQLRTRYNIPLQHIVRHSDISSTKCPGDRFPFSSFLQQLQVNPSRRPRSASR